MRSLACRLAVLAAGLGVLPAPPLQAAPIAGTVIDDRSMPVASARVVVVGTALAATTDLRGKFRIEAVSGASVTLRVSGIGYQPTTVTTQPGALDLTIKLATSVFALNDVVVTGTVGGQETYDHQLTAVIDALATGSPLPTEGDDPVGNMLAIDAIYASAGVSRPD